MKKSEFKQIIKECFKETPLLVESTKDRDKFCKAALKRILDFSKDVGDTFSPASQTAILSELKTMWDTAIRKQ